jgi:hypothetical protein
VAWCENTERRDEGQDLEHWKKEESAGWWREGEKARREGQRERKKRERRERREEKRREEKRREEKRREEKRERQKCPKGIRGGKFGFKEQEGMVQTYKSLVICCSLECKFPFFFHISVKSDTDS